MSEQCDGYINRINLFGKVYKLQCEVVEIYPIICPKCGGDVTLSYGNGQCDYCGTRYTTNFKITEVEN